MAAEVETMYNTREKPWHGLGVVTDRYKVVQNARAFSFKNELLGHGVRVESAEKFFHDSYRG